MTKSEIHENWWNGDRNKRSCCEGIGTGYEYQKRIAELEKENAELKEKLGDIQMQKAGEKSDLVWKLKTANEQKADQLTKAKTYLKYFIEILKRLGANKEPLVVEAEQFISEVGK